MSEQLHREESQPLHTKISLKITFLKLDSNFPAANELSLYR